MTRHAVEEMADDNLDIIDIERAILNGRIIKIDKDDLRGTRYAIMGVGSDELSSIGIVGRFKESGQFLIITVYKLPEHEI